MRLCCTATCCALDSWCSAREPPGWLCVLHFSRALLFNQPRNACPFPCRNFQAPPSHIQTGAARGATQGATSTRLSGIGLPRYRRLRSAPRDFRVARSESLRLASSPEVTEKEPGKRHESDGVEGDGVVELEQRPFPKVGDVVRYEGKWESDMSFGEVRQCTQQPSGAGIGSLVPPCVSIGAVLRATAVCYAILKKKSKVLVQQYTYTESIENHKLHFSLTTNQCNRVIALGS